MEEASGAVWKLVRLVRREFEVFATVGEDPVGEYSGLETAVAIYSFYEKSEGPESEFYLDGQGRRVCEEGGGFGLT